MSMIKKVMMRVPSIKSKLDGSLTWWGFLMLYAGALIAISASYWVGWLTTG